MKTRASMIRREQRRAKSAAADTPPKPISNDFVLSDVALPPSLMRTVRNSAHKNLRLNLSAVRVLPRQFLADNRGAGLLT